MATSGYEGIYIQKPVAIASGQTSSAAFDCGGFNICGMILPATLTGTALSFQVSSAIDGTFQDLYDKSNAKVSITVAQARSYALDPAIFEGFQFFKVVSGTAEAGARTIIFSLKGI